MLRRYTCLLGVGAPGSVVPNSAVELAPGVLYSITISVSTPGSIAVVLRDDPCNPASLPTFMSVNADFTAPQSTLTLLQTPSLANSTFVVAANFSKAVQPVTVDNVTVTGGIVTAVQQRSNTSLQITVGAAPGSEVSVQLTSFGYVDFAGNPGVPSNLLQVSVPAPSLPRAATTLNAMSAAAVAASALSCMAGAVLTPGWTAVACGAGVLRSMGHLQLLGFTGHMSANMPAAYVTATDSAAWPALQFAPDSAVSFATGFSRAAPVLAGRLTNSTRVATTMVRKQHHGHLTYLS